MFSVNLKTLRKAKGLSQEELAIRLNVVRQTVSKWEKGLSVPDADLLIRIADIFEVPVSKLLGATFENEESEKNVNLVAEQLSRINEQLAIKNRRSRRIWKTVAIIFFAFLAINVILIMMSIIPLNNLRDNSTTRGINAEANLNIRSADPNALALAIMIDDTLFTSTGEIITLDIKESDITGNIISIVPVTEYPAENGQTNVDFLKDAQYARHGDGIAVRWEREGRWLLFSRFE